MKILFDLWSLRPPLTGIGNYTTELLKALVQRRQNEYIGFRYFKSCRLEKYFTASAGNSNGMSRLTLSRIKSFPALNSLFFRARKLSSEISVDRYADVYHGFSMVPPSKIWEKSFVPVVYDVSPFKYPEYHPSARLKRLETLARIISCVPRVHTISEFSASEISTYFGVSKNNISVIPPSINPIYAGVAYELSPSYKLTPGRFFLAVGTIEPRKNLATLIAAFSRMSPKFRRDFPLCIAGGVGWGEAYNREEVASLIAEGSLRFLGFVPNDELLTLYTFCTAFCFPSIYEGFGMPILEAFACGANVIASDCPALSEASGGLATHITAKDVDAWSKALDFHSEAAPSEQSRQIRRQFARSYSWDDAAILCENMYSKIS